MTQVSLHFICANTCCSHRNTVTNIFVSSFFRWRVSRALLIHDPLLSSSRVVICLFYKDVTFLHILNYVDMGGMTQLTTEQARQMAEQRSLVAELQNAQNR